MIALQITSMKSFMNHLLVADTFENFLLAEATVSTAHTYQIDGHINKEFYTSEELSDPACCPYDFAQWKEIKPLIYSLIKGKKTPLFFKLVLHLSPANTGKLLAAGKCSIPPEQVKALVLTIKYDGAHAILTTGSAFNTFVMSKEPDEIWDRAMIQFLSRKEIPFEKL